MGTENCHSTVYDGKVIIVGSINMQKIHKMESTPIIFNETGLIHFILNASCMTKQLKYVSFLTQNGKMQQI